MLPACLEHAALSKNSPSLLECYQTKIAQWFASDSFQEQAMRTPGQAWGQLHKGAAQKRKNNQITVLAKHCSIKYLKRDSFPVLSINEVCKEKKRKL